MKAFLRSVRIAPKKANLIAKMVRGMPVQDALEMLRRTNKKAARIIEGVVESARANAVHNDKQDPHVLIIKTIVVNQGLAYNRGVPKARGQMRPMQKFLSHINVTLGIADVEAPATPAKAKKERKVASQKKATPVQKAGSSAKKTSTKDTESTSATSSSSAS